MLLLCLLKVISSSVKSTMISTKLSRGTASSYGYNTSSKSILTPLGAFPGREISLIGSKTSPIAPSAYNSTTNNNTAITSALYSSACCFVVQDTIDVRYWSGEWL